MNDAIACCNVRSGDASIVYVKLAILYGDRYSFTVEHLYRVAIKRNRIAGVNSVTVDVIGQQVDKVCIGFRFRRSVVADHNVAHDHWLIAFYQVQQE